MNRLSRASLDAPRAPAVARRRCPAGRARWSCRCMSWSLLPSFKERDVRISWEAAPGTSLPEMRRIVTQATQELRQIPGVRNVAAHIGRAITGDQVVDVEFGAALGQHGSQSRLRRDARRHSRRPSQGYPGVDGDVQTYLSDRVKDGPDDEQAQPIVVRVQGPEREVLRREAEKVAKMLPGVPGVVNPRVERRGRDASGGDQGGPRGGRAGRAQAGRRSAGGRHRVCRPRGRQPLRAAEGVRGRRLGRARSRGKASPTFATF